MHYIIIIATEDAELFNSLALATTAAIESVEIIHATTREETETHYRRLGSRGMQPSSVVIDNRLEDSGFIYSKLLYDRTKDIYTGSIITYNGHPGWVGRYMDNYCGDVDMDVRYPWLLPLHIYAKDIPGSTIRP